MQSTLGVILERSRDAEDGHDRVARELLDRTAGTLDLGGHRLVETFEVQPDALRILIRRRRGRVGQVGEQDRRDLALLS